MTRHNFGHSAQLKNFSPLDVYDWHDTEHSLARLLPPWSSATILERSRPSDGARVRLRSNIGLMSHDMTFEHFDCHRGMVKSHFSVRMTSGPLPFWQHKHIFDVGGPDNTLCEDQIEYELPAGISAGQGLFEKELARMFDFRKEMLKNELTRWSTYLSKEKLCFAVTGGTGFVGSAVVDCLGAAGQNVRRLVRNTIERKERDVLWNTGTGDLEASGDLPDVFVHLAGESILGRWTESQKERIRSSRIDATRRLCEGILKLPKRPRVFISASAIGFYGERGDELLTEDSPKGSGFLSDVVEGWEDASRALEDAGIRVVRLRIGTILNPRGGALAQMITPFKFYMGGRLGSGQQYVSWIALDDLLSIIAAAATDGSMSGVYNAAAPAAVRNAEFTATLAKVLNRAALIPVPETALKLIFGEFATEALLPSTRVEPARLLKHGFKFAYPDLEPALRFMLGKKQGA